MVDLRDNVGGDWMVIADERQPSLWPAAMSVPVGFHVAYQGPSLKQCMDYIDASWTDASPPLSTGGGPSPARSSNGRAAECIQELFSAQAERTPDAAALVWLDQQLSYRELAEKSDRLAIYLRSRKIGPTSLVALCIERSPQMIVALLGILKAGAAYVPIDPEYPTERIRFILEHTDTRLVLTQKPLAFLFMERAIEIILLDEHQEYIDLLPAIPVENATSGSDTAYVIHTSGSTGRPKGVLVSHSSLLNHSVAVNKHFRLGSGDRVLQCRSLSFDAAAEEIFPALVHGSTLVLTVDPLRQTFRDLTQQIIDTETTFLSVPTAFWHSWVLEEDCLIRLASESSLRFILVAGEKANRHTLRTWKRYVAEDIRWCNVYGPTEATITTTVYEPGADWESQHYSSVPIGRPIENVQVHILGKDLMPVSDGDSGELYIGGDGVAIGYLNAPSLTALRFVPDSFSNGHGRRLYRTGDIVRSRGDGCLEFIGRLDHQVKLKGYRIELGEIELALAEHPDVRACVVALKAEDPEKQGLVCGVETRAGVTAADLRKFLRDRLPWYMIPSSILVLDELPMTPNGKIDRNALLSLEAPQRVGDHIAPRTPTEAAIYSIWEEILEQHGFSIDEDFFELGGHSLLVARLISKVRSRLRVNLPVRTLFEAPTIEKLAAAVTRMAPVGSASSGRG